MKNSNKEKIHINELNKITHIFKVINSCQTIEQLNNSREWAIKITTNAINSYPEKSFKNCWSRKQYLRKGEDKILNEYFKQKLLLTTIEI